MMNFYDFIKSIGNPSNDFPKSFPDKIEFNTTKDNYVQLQIECELIDGDQMMIPQGRTFYVTNDEKDGLYYKIESKNPLTKRELVIFVLNWLLLRNSYYNVKIWKENGKDISGNCSDFASNIALHGLKKSEKTYNGHVLYNMIISE